MHYYVREISKINTKSMAHLEYSIPHASLLAMGVEEKKRN
jgi:hypothetical protein